MTNADGGVIAAGGNKVIAVVRLADAVDNAAVSLEPPEPLADMRIPKAPRFVGGGGHNLLAVRGPVQLQDCALVPQRHGIVGAVAIRVPKNCARAGLENSSRKELRKRLTKLPVNTRRRQRVARR